jgi:hypothetical protein
MSCPSVGFVAMGGQLTNNKSPITLNDSSLLSASGGRSIEPILWGGDKSKSRAASCNDMAGCGDDDDPSLLPLRNGMTICLSLFFFFLLS